MRRGTFEEGSTLVRLPRWVPNSLDLGSLALCEILWASLWGPLGTHLVRLMAGFGRLSGLAMAVAMELAKALAVAVAVAMRTFTMVSALAMAIKCAL